MCAILIALIISTFAAVFCHFTIGYLILFLGWSALYVRWIVTILVGLAVMKLLLDRDYGGEI